MAKVSKLRVIKPHLRCKSNPFQMQACSRKILKHVNKKKHSTTLERKEWEDATCSVCLESPHNAVLLLCSSYNNGCRPYMCATGYRFSNCLDEYKKAYSKVTPVPPSIQTCGDSKHVFGLCLGCHDEKMEVPELLCPLCRGQVKGWTVVEPARKFLNEKKRTCMQEGCSFVGDYKQLKKHVKGEHPSARPREVDPGLEEEWKRLEQEREFNDVISTVTSSMPGAIIVGDYVIEVSRPFFRDYNGDGYSDDDDDAFPFETFRARRNVGFRFSQALGRRDHFHGDDDVGVHPRAASSEVDHAAPPISSHHHHRRLLLSQLVRRRRRGEANDGP
ncbi:hypothetical protein Nepgr_024265 [Nepenthes gracilis]|uniref:Uncharacterized protein n=1 Tax=Nepenthes gracilis TaxID=150966 RepID=A0AAD3XYF6_NEPGR|nr:hypothetical protein Nepgr_024265 [Nepenthes gracilis]